MKKTCVDCKARFEFSADELDDGDPFDCPECGLEYTVVYESDKPTLVESKTLEMENSDFELDEDEDYS
jgi:DNA-directed RNA polymerase subunit RPC12/RpoP